MLPVVALVAFNAVIPLMTVVNYSVQETFGDNLFFFEGLKWFEQILHSERFHDALQRQLLFTGIILAIEVPLGVGIALAMPRKGVWVSVCLVLMAMPLLIPWNVVGAMWNIFALPDIGLLGKTLNSMGIDYNFTRQPVAAWVTLIAMDVWHWTSLVVLLAYAGLSAIPGCLLSGRSDRRRLVLGRLSLHPAAQAQAGADHRGAAALHGQLQHLHRALRAHRRRTGQCHDLAVHRPGQDRAGAVRPRAGGGHVPDLFPDHPAAVLGVLRRHDPRGGLLMQSASRIRLKWLVPTLYIVFLMLPIYWLLNMSFKTTNEILGGFSLYPQSFTLENYRTIFTDPTWYNGYINSLIYVCLNTVISVAVALPAAYAFSRYRFLGDKHLFFWLLTNRMAPAAVFALPFFQLYSAIGLFDTHLAVALAHCLFNIPLAVWILEGFMSGVPKELDETAFIDGYGFWRFFVKIFLPTIAAGIGVAAFFCFMFSWVELLLAKTLTSVAAKPIAATMTRTASTSGYELGLLAAAGALTIVPGALVIFFVRNYIAKGFALGRV